MRKWEVSGADRSTGEEKIVTIYAEDQDEAMRQATKTMLVSSVSSVVADIKQPGSNVLVSGQVPPSYKGIIQGATVLRMISLLWIAAGVLSIVAGVFAAMAAIGNIGDRRDVFTEKSITYIVGGLASLAGAAIINMLAQLSMAMRDLTRNSYRN